MLRPLRAAAAPPALLQALDGQSAGDGEGKGDDERDREAAAVDEYMRKAEVMGMDAQSRCGGGRAALTGRR